MTRMASLSGFSRPDFAVLIGKYTIDPSPLTPAQIAAPPPNANSPDTMPILSRMPQLLAGSQKEASAGTTRK